jgi:hypothetical protein
VHAVSVSGLKPNPEGGLLQAPGARDALATALFWDGELSLVRSAHAAKPPSRQAAIRLTAAAAAAAHTSRGSRR